MKILACFVPLAGLLMLGACNSPNPSNAAVDPHAVGTSTPKAGATKIVGYSDQVQGPAGYGQGLGDAGGGGHHH